MLIIILQLMFILYSYIIIFL